MNCPRILPDLDGELSDVLDVLEDVLLLVPEMDSSSGLTVAGRRPCTGCAVPSPPARDCRVGRVADGLLAPDGRYEHLPMSLIEIDPSDVEVVSDAVGLLSISHAPQAVIDSVDAFVSDLICLLPGRLASGADLRGAAICHLERAVRILHVTGSGDTASDTAVLRQPLSTAAGGVDVAFTCAQEAAYQRLACRFNAVCADGCALDRFLY